MAKRYCLADYIVGISIPEEIGFGSTSLEIGGEGSYLDSITVAYDGNLFSLDGDDTGSWVFNKSLQKTGSVTISINQMSDQVAKFISLCNIFSNLDSSTSGLTITVMDSESNIICTCEDCYLEGIPEQAFQSDAQKQNWKFLCGKITFN